VVTKRPPTELKIVGGDPALDFVNTVGDDRVADPLGDYASFAAWAARIEVIDAATADRLAARAGDRPAAAQRALAEARALRGAMDAVFRPLALPAGEPPPDALARLVQRAGAAVERAHLERAGADNLGWSRRVSAGADNLGRSRRGSAGSDTLGRSRRGTAGGAFVPAWGGDHLERPLWPLAVTALDLLRAGPLDRLKVCASCPWLFIDTSRNRSRRWCSMDECGVRIKMRRYRAKAGR
jgi:predicted RNA-binding Zn ribbon-like protein